MPTQAMARMGVPGVAVSSYLSLEEVLDGAGADVLVLPHPLSAEHRAVLVELTNIGVVQALSSGLDHLQGLLPPGTQLVGAPCLHAAPTAEWALTLILSMLNLPPALMGVGRLGETEWTRTGVRGKRTAVVGPGHVGLLLGQMLSGLGCRVSYLGRAETRVLHQGLTVEELRTADVVVLAAPLTVETVGLMDARALAQLQDGALLVNVSRGRLVDTASLVEHVASGRLRAALDVTHPEPLPAGHPLLSAPNTLLTPHLAAHSATFESRSIAFVLDQIRRYEAGEKMQCRLNGSPCARGFDV